MGLRAKFNLVMLAAFIIGMAGAGFVSYQVLQRNAREEILHTAGILMESAMAVRSYTVKEIRPLLSVQIKRDFLPQTVPAYAATTNIRNLREKYPEYTYKEATLNPTNPASRATDWESSIVDYFRNNQDKKEIVGEHDTATGPMLYIARPIQIKNQNCLRCHGKIDDAPSTMLARYGSANGFGWKMNEVVGSQIVSVPMSLTGASRGYVLHLHVCTGRGTDYGVYRTQPAVAVHCHPAGEENGRTGPRCKHGQNGRAGMRGPG